MLSCMAAQQISRQQRAVAERLVKLPRDPGHQRSRLFDGEPFEMVLGLKELCHALRMATFIEARLVEADAEGLERAPGNVARCKCGDCRAVYTAGKKGAQRDVSDEPALDRPVEQIAQALSPFTFG